MSAVPAVRETIGEAVEFNGKRGAGKFFLVDKEDLHLVNRFKWYLSRNGYVVLSHIEDGYIYLHRMLLNAKPGEHTDHINGTRLDNRRSNLRICSQAENNCNLSKRADSTQPYKGIRKRDDKWEARLRHHGKEVWLGRFETPEDAAIAYNNAAAQVFGEFARKVKI